MNNSNDYSLALASAGEFDLPLIPAGFTEE